MKTLLGTIARDVVAPLLIGYTVVIILGNIL